MKKNRGEMDSVTSDSALNDDDLIEGDEDEFGIESGGWCCFTNSLPIIYLQMWLNKKPNLTQFISRKIPQDVQLDSTNSVASKNKEPLILPLLVRAKRNHRMRQ
jgi:hypothetical protein